MIELIIVAIIAFFVGRITSCFTIKIVVEPRPVGTAPELVEELRDHVEKTHRMEDPADAPIAEPESASEFWYRDGKLHREDGSAVDAKKGAEEWYRHGKLHRVDGPAAHASAATSSDDSKDVSAPESAAPAPKPAAPAKIPLSEMSNNQIYEEIFGYYMAGSMCGPWQDRVPAALRAEYKRRGLKGTTHFIYHDSGRGRHRPDLSL